MESAEQVTDTWYTFVHLLGGPCVVLRRHQEIHLTAIIGKLALAPLCDCASARYYWKRGIRVG